MTLPLDVTICNGLITHDIDRIAKCGQHDKKGIVEKGSVTRGALQPGGLKPGFQRSSWTGDEKCT